MKLGLLFLVAGLTACSSLPDQPLSRDESSVVFELPSEKTLLIRDLSVVNAPSASCAGAEPASCGAWSFGALMAGLSASDDPAVVSSFTLQLLNQWNEEPSVNGFVIPKRQEIQTLVIEPWLTASGGQVLDFSKAPLRLLAIVNRMDLRRSTDEGPLDAGELRLVFGVLDQLGYTLPFTLIFEYQLPATTCAEVHDWANAWIALSRQPFGVPYNAALEALTTKITSAGAGEGRPNGSLLKQLRSNETALATPWEMRQFELTCPDGAPVCANATLAPATVSRTPAAEFKQTALLAAFINQQQDAIVAGDYTVPLSFEQTAFRGARASPSAAKSLAWDAPGIDDPAARGAFALGTCDGCHAVETNTLFQHLKPRSSFQIAEASTWLIETDLPRRKQSLLAARTCAP